MELKVITPPSNLPLDYSDVQEYLRLETEQDTETITNLIKSVTSLAQEYTNRTFISTEYQLFNDRLPASLNPDDNYIILDKGPIVSVDEIKVHITDSVGSPPEEVLTDYILTNETMDGKVYPLSTYTWELTGTPRNRKAVEITFTAGYGTSKRDVPFGLKSILIQMVSFLYENREGTVIPEGITKGLDAYRIVTI